MQVLGVPVKPLAFADSKPVARTWLSYHYSTGFPSPHIYADNERCMDSDLGPCYAPGHGNRSKGASCPIPQQPIVTFAGLPCRPYAKPRYKKGDSAGTCAVDRHAAIGTVNQFRQYLVERRPGVWVVEESDMFSHGEPSPLNMFIADCSSVGYCCIAKKLDHKMFGPLSRVRWWIAGFSASHGGQSAADWYNDRMDELIGHLAMRCSMGGIVQDVFDVVNPFSIEEVARRERVEEPFV